MSQDGLKFWGGPVGNNTLINVSSNDPLPVTTTGGAGLASNITQIGGATLNLGQALSAASLPVVLASDSLITITGSVTASGTITLGAGSASVGTVVLGAGSASVGTVVLGAGSASVGTVVLGAGSASVGTVVLGAGSAAVGSLTAGTAVIGQVNLAPQTSGGLSMSSTIISSTTATVVKGSAGQVYGIGIDNNTAGTVYLKIYNATSATAGSGTPALRIMCPGPTNGGGAARDIHQPNGIAFGTGITFIVTQLQADNDTTAVPASSVTVNILYK